MEGLGGLKELEKWTIELNKYQRDNLLFLLNLCGYPIKERIYPFCYANTGDWLGEIVQMLKDEDGSLVIKKANVSREWIEENIQFWLRQQVKG